MEDSNPDYINYRITIPEGYKRNLEPVKIMIMANMSDFWRHTSAIFRPVPAGYAPQNKLRLPPKLISYSLIS